jgi:hypothetical protein
MNNKGQVGTTLTWAVAFVAITLILFFFILITLYLITERKIEDITSLDNENVQIFSSLEYHYSIFLFNFLSYGQDSLPIYFLLFQPDIEEDYLKEKISQFFIVSNYEKNKMGYAIDIEWERLVSSKSKVVDNEKVFQRIKDVLVYGKKSSLDGPNQIIELGIYLEDLEKKLTIQ